MELLVAAVAHGSERHVRLLLTGGAPDAAVEQVGVAVPAAAAPSPLTALPPLLAPPPGASVTCLHATADGLVLAGLSTGGLLFVASADPAADLALLPTLLVPLLEAPVRSVAVSLPPLGGGGGGETGGGDAHADARWVVVLHADGAVVCMRLRDVRLAAAAALLAAATATASAAAAAPADVPPLPPPPAIVPFTRLHLLGARGVARVALVRPLRAPLFEPTWDVASRTAHQHTQQHGLFGGGGSGGGPPAGHGAAHHHAQPPPPPPAPLTLLVAARSPPAAVYHVDLDGGGRTLGELAVAAAARLGSAVRGLAHEVGARLPPPVTSGLRRLGGGLLSSVAYGSRTTGLGAFLPAAVVAALDGATRGSEGSGGEQQGAAGSPARRAQPGGAAAVAPPDAAADAAARLASLRGAHGRSVPADVELQDEDRVLTALAADPLTGRYVLATDATGRVLLLDAADATVLRLWKGYRDAQVGWLSVTTDEGWGAAEEANLSEGGDGGQRCRHRRARHPQLACVLYLPRRRQLEAWPAGPVGGRLAVLPLRLEAGGAARLVSVPPVATPKRAGQARPPPSPPASSRLLVLIDGGGGGSGADGTPVSLPSPASSDEGKGAAAGGPVLALRHLRSLPTGVGGGGGLALAELLLTAR